MAKLCVRVILILFNMTILLAFTFATFQYFLYFVSTNIKLSVCEVVSHDVNDETLFTSCRHPKCFTLQITDMFVILIMHMKLLSQLFAIISITNSSADCDVSLLLASFAFNTPWIAFNLYDLST